MVNLRVKQKHDTRVGIKKKLKISNLNNEKILYDLLYTSLSPFIFRDSTLNPLNPRSEWKDK